jgi:hypothetical protein
MSGARTNIKWVPGITGCTSKNTRCTCAATRVTLADDRGAGSIPLNRRPPSRSLSLCTRARARVCACEGTPLPFLSLSLSPPKGAAGNTQKQGRNEKTHPTVTNETHKQGDRSRSSASSLDSLPTRRNPSPLPRLGRSHASFVYTREVMPPLPPKTRHHHHGPSIEPLQKKKNRHPRKKWRMCSKTRCEVVKSPGGPDGVPQKKGGKEEREAGAI